MKILIISLLKRKITPDIAAARPRIIFELIKGLIDHGHQVTILGTKDSHVPGAKIIPVIDRSFVDLPSFENPFYAHTSFLVMMAKKIIDLYRDFDIIHNHTYPEFINLLIENQIRKPMVTTIHAQATPELDQVLSVFSDSYLISISNAHKRLFKKAQIYRVIYNGVDTDLYSYYQKKDDYLLWLGRLSAAKNEDGSFIDPKGVRWAIELAKKTNNKLLISGNVEDIKFYERDIKPYLNDKIKWVGPISKELPLDKQQVVNLMQKAKAFLMTINWQEPFGLVMAESMSCGTPVIGFDRGSVSELVVDGKTGYVVDPKQGIEGLKKALDKINVIKSIECRNHIVNNYSINKMVTNYLKCYQDVIIDYEKKT